MDFRHAGIIPASLRNSTWFSLVIYRHNYTHLELERALPYLAPKGMGPGWPWCNRISLPVDIQLTSRIAQTSDAFVESAPLVSSNTGLASSSNTRFAGQMLTQSPQ